MIDCLFHRSGFLTDVTLTAGGVEVRAHRNVLAACSPYFFAMFQVCFLRPEFFPNRIKSIFYMILKGFSESQQDRIELKEVDPEALRSLIDYVYTSRYELCSEIIVFFSTKRYIYSKVST